jgi:hypothetical protein
VGLEEVTAAQNIAPLPEPNQPDYSPGDTASTALLPVSTLRRQRWRPLLREADGLS